ncbi:MAG: CDP-glycerol glycerophosphotransferase family protein [Mycetocola sp.]
MGILRDARKAVKIGRDLLANRRARAALSHRLAQLPPLEANKYKIAVYFADGEVNMYQIRQWYKPLQVLGQTWPVVVLSRGATAATRLFEESPLPVAYVRTVVALERTLAEQDIRIVFYVNQNTKNFQMFRYGQRWHVFINHGESDKMYMTTNQFKAYDYSFVAGDAAIARLEKVLWDYDFDKRAIRIGRPQADHYSGTLPYTPDDRTVVLYAPTWEGDRRAAAYGSIATHGVALVRALLATGNHRVIYRPHPRSGVVDHAYAAANREIIGMLASANSADPAAHHVYDTGSELGWQLSAADVAIVDISAMVYDRLASGKPLLVTRPADPEALVDTNGYLSACEWLPVEEASSIVALVDRVLHDPETVGRLDFWVRHYFGDPTPGAATQRFHDAVEQLMGEWERYAALHSGDEPTQLTTATAATAVPVRSGNTVDDLTQSHETGEDDD